MGQQAQCSNYRPKVSPGNNYISFHGRASETKTRPPAGYLRGLDLFCIFPSVTFKSPVAGTGLPWLGFLLQHSETIMKIKVWDFSVLLLWLLCSPLRTPCKTVWLSMRCLSFPCFVCPSVLRRLQHGGANPSWSHQHWHQTSQLLWKARRRQLPRWVVVSSNTVSSCIFFFHSGNWIHNGSSPT